MSSVRLRFVQKIMATAKKEIPLHPKQNLPLDEMLPKKRQRPCL